jgi:phage-related protein
VKPNTTFKLDVKDIHLIETSLRYMRGLDTEKAKEVQQLLGKIHDQKVWYRPNNKIYVSG